MANLVTPSEILAYLGDPTGSDVQIGLQLVDEVEALLLQQCGREGRPFQPAQTGRVERRDGTGRPVLFLDYPIGVLTTVKLGYNVASPDETLVVNDQTKLSWAVGSPRLYRVDGGIFGWQGQPGAVSVTYTTQDDLPEDAALAVKRVTSALFNSRGSEGASSERLGNYSIDLKHLAEEDPIWQRVIGGRRLVVA